MATSYTNSTVKGGSGGWLGGNVKALLGQLNVNNNNDRYVSIHLKARQFRYCLAFTLFIRKVNYIVEECLCFRV